MKKKVVVTLILVFSFSFSLFAESNYGNMHGSGDSWGVRGITNKMPHTVSSRIDALGGTGTVLSTGLDSLYLNPANLANAQKLFLDVPLLDIQIQPFAGLLSSMKDMGKGENGKLNLNMQKLLDIALNQLLSKGNNPLLLNINAGVGFAVKGFGFNAFLDYGLFAFSKDLPGNAQVFPMMTAGVSVGYGGTVYKTKLHKIDIGASFTFMLRAYSEPMTANSLMSGFGGGDGDSNSSGFNFMDLIFPKDKPAMVGFMHPISIGMTYTFMNQLSASLALNNIWPSVGGMHNFETLTSGLSGIWSSSGRDKATGTVGMGVFDTASLDIGIGWNPHWKWFNPRVELDFYDLLHYSDMEKQNFKYFFGSHMRLGIELFLAEFLAIRFGMDGGRLSFGARLDLWPIVIDATYGWREWGEVAGAKSVDYFSLVIKFGWDRTK